DGASSEGLLGIKDHPFSVVANLWTYEYRYPDFYTAALYPGYREGATLDERCFIEETASDSTAAAVGGADNSSNTTSRKASTTTAAPATSMTPTTTRSTNSSTTSTTTTQLLSASNGTNSNNSSSNNSSNSSSSNSSNSSNTTNSSNSAAGNSLFSTTTITVITTLPALPGGAILGAGDLSPILGASTTGRGISMSRVGQPDKPLTQGACFVLQVTRIVVLVGPCLILLAILAFAAARWRVSLSWLVVGALLAALYCATGMASLVLAAILSVGGLLAGSGTLSLLVSILFAMLGSSMAIFQASKSTPKKVAPEEQAATENEEPEEEEEENSDSDEENHRIDDKQLKKQRIERSRKAWRKQDALKAIEDIALNDLAEKRARARIRRESNQQNSGVLKAPKALSPKAAVKQTAKKTLTRANVISFPRNQAVPSSMRAILGWGGGDGEGGTFGRRIPMELLANAFKEIDEDGSGFITPQEFRDAIIKCGLEPSEKVMDLIMNEIDEDGGGDIEVDEFINFFQLVQDLLKEEAAIANSANLSILLCQFCFLVHVAAVTVLVLMAVRGSGGAEEEELTEVKKSERQMVQYLIFTVCGLLVVFFIFVVGVPMFRLSLGPSMAAWKSLWRNRKRPKESLKEHMRATITQVRTVERRTPCLVESEDLPSGSHESGRPGSPDSAEFPQRPRRKSVSSADTDHEPSPVSPNQGRRKSVSSADGDHELVPLSTGVEKGFGNIFGCF
ncbi:unnamed protein product, partial [Polarella glacialis]